MIPTTMTRARPLSSSMENLKASNASYWRKYPGDGYYFLLDRVTGEHLLTTKYMPETNWAKGIDAEGRPIPDYAKHRFYLELSLPLTLSAPRIGGRHPTTLTRALLL